MLTYNPSLWEYGVKDALVRSLDIAEPTLVGKIASYEQSSSYHNLYPWIGEAPYMVKMLQKDLQIAGMSNANVEVLNDTYAIGIEVDRDSIHDDQLGAIMRRVMQMAAVARNFPNRLLAAALESGTTLTSFDGAAFFSDTHPARGQLTSSQDNLLAGTGVTATAIKADLISAIAAAMNWKGENGEPLTSSRTSWTCVVPPAIMFPMLEAINAPVVPVVFGSNTAAASQGNVAFQNAGMTINVHATPRLTDVNDWYLCDNGPVKPLIYQEASPVEIESLLAGSPDWVKREKAIFKARWRGGVGYNQPGLAFKIVNS